MGEHKDHMTKALRGMQDRGEITGMPKEPPEGFSKNARAEKLLGLRRTDCTAFDQPCELGYHCPLCEYPYISKDGNYDERLHWSEYESMIWCSVCNVDYPSCLCLPGGSGRATDVFLASVGEAVARRIPEGKKDERPTKEERQAALAMLLQLPDVARVHFSREDDIVIEVFIRGEQYDDAQMDRLIGAEMRFLKEHPDCDLSFRYIPANPTATRGPQDG